MKRLFNILALSAALLLTLSCYEDYLGDYEAPSMGFSYPRQVRTVVADTPVAYVGVSIGGLRELSLHEWAGFAVDESLLSGTPYKLMPGEYYTFSDPNTMRARRKTLFTADVAVTFTDKFFEDAQALKNTYAIPFRIMAVSLADQPDSTGAVNAAGAIRKGGETAVVVFKYISAYSGTYYRVGTEVEIDDAGNPVGVVSSYNAYDLVDNPTVDLTTLSRYAVQCPGLGTSASGAVNLHVVEVDGAQAYGVRMEGAKGAVLADYTARYVPEGDYPFFSGDETAPQFELDYVYTAGGRTFKVSEKLVLRQWPAKDLRVETF